MVSAAASMPSVAPQLPEGWQAIWDNDEHDWYFYHPRTKASQWAVPGQQQGQKVSRCGVMRFLTAIFKSKTRTVQRIALPSTRTLEAIAKLDHDMNDEEIAMVLQQEEYSQDLSGRRHSFDQNWLDTSNYYAAQDGIAEAGQSSTSSQAIRASMIFGASHAKIQDGDIQQNASKPECGICMDDDDWCADWTWLECAHQFHTKCVDDWLKTAARCPVCRTEVKVIA